MLKIGEREKKRNIVDYVRKRRTKRENHTIIHNDSCNESSDFGDCLRKRARTVIISL